MADSRVVADTDVATAAALLASAAEVTLLAHVNPDADALGSALALGTALHRRGARVRVSFGDPAEVPESLRGLDPEGLFVTAAELPDDPGLVVVLDTGSASRLGRLAALVETTVVGGGEVLVVDHHVSNTRFGTRHVIDERAEATALLALRLLDALDVELDELIARCLYAGIVTDTRSFRNASPGVHRVATRLLEAGVQPAEATRPLLDTHPYEWLGMLSGVLGRARLEADSARGLGLVHAVVRLDESFGLRSEELDSVIDLVRTTAEADVALVLKETAPDRWQGSLRSDGALDVGGAAVEVGGGGHRLAAGFTAHGDAESVIASVRAALASARRL